MKLKSNLVTILNVVALSLIVPLTSCSFFYPIKKEQTISANFDIPVKDPTIRRLTEVTSRCHIKANGKFKAGTYLLNNVPVSVKDGTLFRLDLTLPVNNPDVINTEEAQGSLHTTKQISVANLPVPLDISLQDGELKGQFNLGRALAVFFFNLIQLDVPRGEISGMVESLQIDEIKLDMRPESIMTIGKKKLHLGEHSSILIKDALVKNDLSFQGTSIFDLHFLPDCKWIGEKVDCEFDGGQLQLNLGIERLTDKMRLSLIKGSKLEPVKLENCVFRFGKNKRSHTLSKLGEMDLREFIWEKKRGVHPTMHLYSSMDMTDTDLTLKTDIHQTTGHFPGRIPGLLSVDVKDDSRPTKFLTTGIAKASTGKIEINTKTAHLAFLLSDVSVGKVVYGKADSLDFNLAGGNAKLNEFICDAKNSSFALKCGKGSTIKLPAEMLLEKNNPQNKNQPTEVRLPISLKVGDAILQTKKRRIELEKLSGEFLITTGSSVNIYSDLKFSLGQSSMLDGYDADVSADSLNVNFKNGDMLVDVKKCAIEIPQQALEAAIRKKIPTAYTMDLNRTVKEEEEWRYRNAIIKTLQIDNFDITEMKTVSQDHLSFKAKANILLDGSVEKTGIIKRGEWETKSWKLKGEAIGSGKVTYNFGGSKKNKLIYNLSMKVPFPDNAELDWSQVSSGLVKLAEKTVILNHLKKVVIPLSKNGELELVGQKGSLSNFEVSNIQLTNIPGGKQVCFSLSLLR